MVEFHNDLESCEVRRNWERMSGSTLPWMAPSFPGVPQHPANPDIMSGRSHELSKTASRTSMNDDYDLTELWAAPSFASEPATVTGPSLE